MANSTRPNGMRPVGHLDGSPFLGKLTMYLVPAADGTAMFVGDPVKSGGTAGAAGVACAMALSQTAGASRALRALVSGDCQVADAVFARERGKHLQPDAPLDQPGDA